MMIKLRSILSDKNFLPNLVSGVTIVVAILLVILGMLSPWFAIPHIVDNEVVTRDSSITVYFKILLLN